MSVALSGLRWWAAIALLTLGASALAAPKIIPFDGPLDQIGRPHYARRPGSPSGLLTPQSARAATRSGAASTTSSAIPGIRSIPNWAGSFDYQGITYPYFMVGNDPASGQSSTVKADLIPIRLVFGGGEVLNGAQYVGKTLQSPLFSDYDYITGKGQFTDAVQRATFWNTMPANHRYHVDLEPEVRDTVVLHVPDDEVTLLQRRSDGNILAVISYTWFAVAMDLIIAQQPRATHLVMPLTYNVVLADNPATLSGCCVIGFHTYTAESHDDNGVEDIQTWGFASWMEPGWFTASNLADIHPLSHELSEWANDPFLNNVVPGWQTPSAPQYGCTDYLETGDPLVGYSTPVTGKNGVTYHPQTEALLPWFARFSPSNAINGAYSFPDTTAFTSPATGCSP